MFSQISLHILDIVQNSLRAGAENITISVDYGENSEFLTVEIQDDGCGMNDEEVSRVTDPFYTTRRTREIGLGIPFFKAAAECSGGDFCIKSVKGEGTCVIARFVQSHIDCLPMGDIVSTVCTLMTANSDKKIKYIQKKNGIIKIIDLEALSSLNVIESMKLIRKQLSE